ncbi:hypothetical protein LTR78_006109 [Recurvomyces mirabilis]|uniref:Uncharacterized protein n=1 Tax=Recurvomyces mirabilis TaxID=574656 RepID=A0AAE0WLG2_9PEZI|nr:hypothetical protein LTR78_006109 [Recurvomyces mirabilis]KAK5151952.1 hypothetical protein LTS14_008726 [Recurvomyces mirabilis]
MGIPYSKQINAAFDEVTPLVTAGFEVLQTLKNIALTVAVIQVLTVVILTAVLIVLVALLITINPDLATERKLVVTPVVRWFVHVWLEMQSHWRTVLIGGMIILLGVALGAVGGVLMTQKDFQKLAEEEQQPSKEKSAETVDADEG